MSAFTRFAVAYQYVGQHDGELYKLRSKLAREPKQFTVEDAKELDYKYSTMERKYHNLCNMLISALPEVARLEAENNFMLRLINEHRIAE